MFSDAEKIPIVLFDFYEACPGQHTRHGVPISLLPYRMFPKNSTAPVTGLGGLGGGLGELLLTLLVQKRMFVHYETIGQINKGYFIMYLICGGAYLTGRLIMHYLVPRMKPVE